MITVNDQKICFCNIGYFKGGEDWKHPDVAITTLEVIFVTKGVIYLHENGTDYELHENDLLLLDPNIRHYGFRKSGCDTRFYWIHFLPFPYKKLNVKKYFNVKSSHALSDLLAQLNHLSESPAHATLIEMKLWSALMEICERSLRRESALAYRVADYVRTNADLALTVKNVADHFGYNSNYVSKLFCKTHAVPLKKHIENERVAAIKNNLLSSDYSIKEIADHLNFPDANALEKFFKYHTALSPSEYRNSFYATHTNKT